MKRIYNYLKKDAVLTISWVLAIISMLFIKPDKAYAGYIDWRSLGILWSLMIITKGYMQNGIFEKIGHALLARTRKMWQLIAVLVGLNFFSSMIITNDVSLITFVPFAIMMLKQCGRQELMIPVVVLQTIAANLGSMLTPIGNPQNLYLPGFHFHLPYYPVWYLQLHHYPLPCLFPSDLATGSDCPSASVLLTVSH